MRREGPGFLKARLPGWIPAAVFASVVGAGVAGAESLPPGVGGEAAPAVSPAAARGVWERLQGLDGKWIGESTKGWREEIDYRIIAAGSVVMGTSFDAHPRETMVTMYHLDGNRLLLTHYCVAKNQPRLRLTRVSEGGTVAEFTFLDATGMPDRNRGHMDSVVLRFQDDDRFTSRWTWYEDGESRWMEEIHCTRVR